MAQTYAMENTHNSDAWKNIENVDKGFANKKLDLKKYNPL